MTTQNNGEENRDGSVPATLPASSQLEPLPTVRPPGSVAKLNAADAETQDINRMWAIAACVKNAKFVPAEVRGDQASVFFLLGMARDQGAKWSHALRSLYMTPDGKVGQQGDYILALLLGKGFRIYWPVETEEKAVCQICRPICKCKYVKELKKVDCACGESGEAEFSLALAKTLGFALTKDGREIKDPAQLKPWHFKFNWRDPKNMNKWRSLAYCAKFHAADVLGGVYLVEELQDIALRDREEHTPESLARIAGTDEAPPDETIIDPIDESALRHAAHEASKTQAWVAEKLQEIAAPLQVLAHPNDSAEARALRKSLAHRKIDEAIKELAKPSEKPAPAPAPAPPPVQSEITLEDLPEFEEVP